MNKVRVIVRRDDGNEFEIDNQKRWRIPSSDGLDGFDYVAPSYTTQDNAFGNGARLIGSRIPTKERSVKTIFKGSLEEKREEREKLRRFFQYSHLFDFYYISIH